VTQNSSEFQRWEQRFAVPDYAFGKEPNYFLASCKPLLPRSGRVLAVADGEGRNGVWLAEQGLDVVSLDFSPSAQRKARALAKERGVTVTFLQGDVHTFDYPEAAFDVVAEIFTQFSTPANRALKWAGTRKALKPGGLLIIQGYAPKQLQYSTGGRRRSGISIHVRCSRRRSAISTTWRLPKRSWSCTKAPPMAACGMSAVINLTARK